VHVFGVHDELRALFEGAVRGKRHPEGFEIVRRERVEVLRLGLSARHFFSPVSADRSRSRMSLKRLQRMPNIPSLIFMTASPRESSSGLVRAKYAKVPRRAA
jgi:hypothetical protein